MIGVPKTIDNDIGLTERTFGFDTAVQIATDAIDPLRHALALLPLPPSSEAEEEPLSSSCSTSAPMKSSSPSPSKRSGNSSAQLRRRGAAHAAGRRSRTH